MKSHSGPDDSQGERRSIISSQLFPIDLNMNSLYPRLQPFK